jgi:TonB family protein
MGLRLMKPIVAIALCALAPSARTQDVVGVCSIGSSSRQEFETYCRVLDTNPRSSLAHFRIAEAFFLQNNYQSAANGFREVLNGDMEPKWTEVWAHINLGKIFERTAQRERAVNEYKQALRTGDDTSGALDQATNRLKELGADMPPRLRVLAPRAPAEPVAKVSPDYSDEARIAELEGTVLLEGAIGEDGVAHDLTVLRPLGLGLDEKAIDAVRQWLFPPAQPNEQTGSMRSVLAVDFFFSPKLSRWHSVGVDFDTPPGASRPAFLRTAYPTGDGIVPSSEIIERGKILAAIGRPATATLDFDVDERGYPVNIRALATSDSTWGSQAIAFVRDWRFTPGMKDGMPISVPCSIDLMWGPQNITSAIVDKFQVADWRFHQRR